MRWREMRWVAIGLMQTCRSWRHRVNGPDESVRCLPTREKKRERKETRYPLCAPGRTWYPHMACVLLHQRVMPSCWTAGRWRVLINSLGGNAWKETHQPSKSLICFACRRFATVAHLLTRSPFKQRRTYDATSCNFGFVHVFFYNYAVPPHCQ